MNKIAQKSIIVFASLIVIIACKSSNQKEMFTVNQIKEEMMKVKTGADFPVLAMNLKKLGVSHYETKIKDGSSVFYDKNAKELFVGPNYETMEIANKVNLEQLKADITNHQQGQSNYLEISRQCANNGIVKWEVSLTAMTCAYIDKAGNKVLIEHIPDASIQSNQPHD